MKLTDWRGEEYGVGDHVLYTVASGRSHVTVREAEVLEVLKVPHPSPYVAELTPALRVRPLRAVPSYAGTSGKPVLLTSLDRVTRIDP